MRNCVHTLAALLLFLSAAIVISQQPAAAATITFASGAGVTPPVGGSIVDPSIDVSFDNGATWAPSWATESGPWSPPMLGSKWVSPTSDPFQGFGDPQDIRYRISFVLPNGFIQPVLSGFVWSDDQSREVLLNGTSIAYYPYPGYIGEAAPRAYGTTNSAFFVSGVNVVEFNTVNLGGATGVDFVGTVSGIQLPTNANQCKNGGWRDFGVFRNQGDCVSYVATHGANPPRG